MTIHVKNIDSINAAIEKLKQEEIDRKRLAKKAAFGKVKWTEDELEYQKKLRDEWS